MAFSQVTVVANQIDKQRLGYQAISLTNFDSDTDEPQIAAGSKVEIGGALFDADANESITGWAGIANSSDVYIHLTVSGSSVTASFSTTAPTWDTAKQGWYSGSVRVIGGLYKDGSGNYARKWLYEEKQVASVKRYGNGAVVLADDLQVAGAISGAAGAAAEIGAGGIKVGSGDTAWLRKEIEIGDWNMDSTASVDVAHGTNVAYLRVVGIIIRKDIDDPDTEHDEISPLEIGGFWGSYELDYIRLTRSTSGAFDNANYDKTSFNRGYIVIEYAP